MPEFVRYSPWTRKWFDHYLKWNFKKHFSEIRCQGVSSLVSHSGPLLFVSNHVSWWDGFFLFELQRRIRPKAQLYTIALETTVKANPILARMGVLPMEPGNPSSLKRLLSHLKHLRETLPPEQLLVSFFPQGKITPSFKKTLGFQRGVELIAESLNPITLVPVGIHIEPMTGKGPTVLLSVGAGQTWQAGLGASDLENHVQAVLGASIKSFM
ncbi:hypothetical protein EBQ90_10810 [bacterium]|nr:hypothetical protein [bacterium]